ncbi:MAG: hypothetical protein GY798_29950, partial [Hyphomicrobiales bacterium]|nr:hypothetical protein [Hyphomicrobiales bacterium]
MVASLKSLHFNDPDLINLRKAMRAAIVSPLILLIADQGFDQTLVGVFGFLSAFCAFVFADFGGPIRGRAFAYLGLLAASSLSLVAGSLLADTTGLAGLAMAAIVFAVLFAGVFSPTASAFVGSVALAFAFAVFIPLETIGIVDRFFGWSIGGVAAAAGAVLLWPVNSRSEMRTALATAAAALAEILSNRGDEQAQSAAMTRAAAALATAHAKAAAPLRPARVAAHDLGLVNLVESLSGAHQLVEQILAAPPKRADTDLVSHVVKALRRTSAVIGGEATPQDITTTIPSLDRCLVDRRHALGDEAREMVADDGNRDPAAELDRSFPV